MEHRGRPSGRCSGAPGGGRSTLRSTPFPEARSGVPPGMERAVYLGIEAVMGSKTEARVYAERGGGMMVSLVIPAEPSRFMIARSVVTAIAAQVGLPIDAIEDARLAVTECS